MSSLPTSGSASVSGGFVWTGGSISSISSVGSNTVLPTNAYPGSIMLNMNPPVAIEDVSYVIVKQGANSATFSYLQLTEQPGITPREIIGICKFIHMAAYSGIISVKWSQVIEKLGIKRHFIQLTVIGADPKIKCMQLFDAT